MTARVLLRATAGARACVVLERHLDVQMRALAGRLESAVDPETRAAGAELRAFLDELRESARQWREGRPGSVNGTNGTSGTSIRPGQGMVVAPPRIHLVVSEVAERLGFSEVYVRRLCRDSRLSATRPGGVWLIDAESVEDFENGRSAR